MGIYFENVSGSVCEKQQQTAGGLQRSQPWLYIHLPLVIGLAATGVGVEHVIERAGYNELLTSPERWLICGCIALYYGCLAVLHPWELSLAARPGRCIV